MDDHKILIRESYVDSHGHVNNAKYLEMLEEARWEIVTRKGMGFEDIQKGRIGIVLLEINLKFLKEMRLRETICIRTELLEYNGKVGKMRQQMLKEDGTLAADAIGTFGIFDLDLRKLVPAPERWRAALGMDKL